jgi:membrane protein implicated in regulation of membrane protease activity
MSPTSFWLTLAFLALVAEFFSGAFYLLVIAVALAAVAVFLWLNLAPWLAPLAGSLIALVGLALTWRYHHRQPKADPKADDPDLGQPVQVLHILDKGIARVLYRGAEWDAELLDPHLVPGSRGVIVGRDGNRLKITR